MRKNIIVGISILSVFILCSLSYQPIETITQVKESKAFDLDVDEIKELYNKLIELKSQSNDDCGCGDTTKWGLPIICGIIYVILAVGAFLYLNLDWPGIIFDYAIVLGKIFNCGFT